MNIRIVQKKEVVYKNGCSPLFIRFTSERKSKFVSLGVSVLPEHWYNEQQRITDDCTDSNLLNALITTKLEEYRKRIRKLEILEIEINFETLLDTNSRKSPNQTVAEYFGKLIADFKKAGKLQTAAKYSFCLSSLNKFRPTSITFDKVDKTFLAEFEQYLRDRGLSGNTIATKFTNLKSAYNKALEDSVFVSRDNPFAKYKVGKLWTKTRKRAITKEDIVRLKNLELPKDSCFGYKELSRDIFMFSYYTAGINFKDIATLRHSDIVNGRVCYQRHKTKKLISCPLLPYAQHIIEKHCSPFYDNDDYIFPILNRQVHITEQQIFNRVHKVLVRVNANLKMMSNELGLPFPLTTYVARHTYATVLKRSGVNIAIISESLGHSDLSTTQIYLDSFENSQIDEAMKNLL